MYKSCITKFLNPNTDQGGVDPGRCENTYDLEKEGIVQKTKCACKAPLPLAHQGLSNCISEFLF